MDGGDILIDEGKHHTLFVSPKNRCSCRAQRKIQWLHTLGVALGFVCASISFPLHPQDMTWQLKISQKRWWFKKISVVFWFDKIRIPNLAGDRGVRYFFLWGGEGQARSRRNGGNQRRWKLLKNEDFSEMKKLKAVEAWVFCCPHRKQNPKKTHRKETQKTV